VALCQFIPVLCVLGAQYRAQFTSSLLMVLIETETCRGNCYIF